MLGTAGEYKTFGTLRIPTAWAHRLAGQKWSAHYESFEVNTVDPAVFALPEEVSSQLASGPRDI